MQQSRCNDRPRHHDPHRDLRPPRRAARRPRTPARVERGHRARGRLSCRGGLPDLRDHADDARRGRADRAARARGRTGWSAPARCSITLRHARASMPARSSSFRRASCPSVARIAHEAGRAALIGGFTPGEILAAHREGADVVKVFPASTGGPEHLRAIHAVFPGHPALPHGRRHRCRTSTRSSPPAPRSSASATTSSTSARLPPAIRRG